MFGELFKMMAGVSMVHVPYRGIAPALTDLMAGQLQVYFGTLTSSIEYIKAGRLRALAVTTAKRSAALPDLPTLGEFLPSYEASQWYGLGVPKNTPVEIVDKLNTALDSCTSSKERASACWVPERDIDFYYLGDEGDPSLRHVPGCSPSVRKVLVPIRSGNPL